MSNPSWSIRPVYLGACVRVCVREFHICMTELGAFQKRPPAVTVPLLNKLKLKKKACSRIYYIHFNSVLETMHYFVTHILNIC